MLFLRQFVRETVDDVVESSKQTSPIVCLQNLLSQCPSITNHPSIEPFPIKIFNLGLTPIVVFHVLANILIMSLEIGTVENAAVADLESVIKLRFSVTNKAAKAAASPGGSEPAKKEGSEHTSSGAAADTAKDLISKQILETEKVFDQTIVWIPDGIEAEGINKSALENAKQAALDSLRAQ